MTWFLIFRPYTTLNQQTDKAKELYLKPEINGNIFTVGDLFRIQQISKKILDNKEKFAEFGYPEITQELTLAKKAEDELEFLINFGENSALYPLYEHVKNPDIYSVLILSRRAYDAIKSNPKLAEAIGLDKKDLLTLHILDFQGLLPPDPTAFTSLVRNASDGRVYRLIAIFSDFLKDTTEKVYKHQTNKPLPKDPDGLTKVAQDIAQYIHASLLFHEMGHNLFLHMQDYKNLPPMLNNIYGDLQINEFFKEFDGITKRGFNYLESFKIGVFVSTIENFVKPITDGLNNLLKQSQDVRDKFIAEVEDKILNANYYTYDLFKRKGQEAKRALSQILTKLKNNQEITFPDVWEFVVRSYTDFRDELVEADRELKGKGGLELNQLILFGDILAKYVPLQNQQQQQNQQQEQNQNDQQNNQNQSNNQSQGQNSNSQNNNQNQEGQQNNQQQPNQDGQQSQEGQQSQQGQQGQPSQQGDNSRPEKGEIGDWNDVHQGRDVSLDEILEEARRKGKELGLDEKDAEETIFGREINGEEDLQDLMEEIEREAQDLARRQAEDLKEKGLEEIAKVLGQKGGGRLKGRYKERLELSEIDKEIINDTVIIKDLKEMPIYPKIDPSKVWGMPNAVELRNIKTTNNPMGITINKQVGAFENFVLAVTDTSASMSDDDLSLFQSLLWNLVDKHCFKQPTDNKLVSLVNIHNDAGYHGIIFVPSYPRLQNPPFTKLRREAVKENLLTVKGRSGTDMFAQYAEVLFNPTDKFLKDVLKHRQISIDEAGNVNPDKQTSFETDIKDVISVFATPELLNAIGGGSPTQKLKNLLALMSTLVIFTDTDIVYTDLVRFLEDNKKRLLEVRKLRDKGMVGGGLKNEAPLIKIVSPTPTDVAEIKNVLSYKIPYVFSNRIVSVDYLKRKTKTI